MRDATIRVAVITVAASAVQEHYVPVSSLHTSLLCSRESQRSVGNGFRPTDDETEMVRVSCVGSKFREQTVALNPNLMNAPTLQLSCISQNPNEICRTLLGINRWSERTAAANDQRAGGLPQQNHFPFCGNRMECCPNAVSGSHAPSHMLDLKRFRENVLKSLVKVT